MRIAPNFGKLIRGLRPYRLLERGNRVLTGFSEDLSAAGKKRLADLGVVVRLGCGVDQIEAEGVIAAGERILSKTVIWTAGIAALSASSC